MAAIARDYPNSYTEARLYLGRKSERPLSGTATRLQFYYGELCIVYHNTAIVRFYEDGTIELNNGGWPTLTTHRKMTGALHTMGYAVWSEGGVSTLVRFSAPNGQRQRQSVKFIDGRAMIAPDGRIKGGGPNQGIWQ